MKEHRKETMKRNEAKDKDIAETPRCEAMAKEEAMTKEEAMAKEETKHGSSNM